MLTVVVTRPEPHNRELCLLLEEAGYKPIALPLIEVQPFPFEGEGSMVAHRRTTIQNIDQYDGVIVVSHAAAQWLAAGLDHFWPQMPVEIAWWTLGAKSALPLEQLGLMVQQPQQGVDSEALLAMPPFSGAMLQHQKWLLVKGIGGRTLLSDTIEARGASLDQLDVYQRLPIELTERQVKIQLDQFIERADPPAVSMATSIEILHNWVQWLRRPITPPTIRDKYLHSPLIVISERIRAVAQTLGFNHITLAKKPDNLSILATLKEV